MNFQKYDLGNLSAGEIVEITLVQNAANVRLMDSSNFSNYKSGRRHQYFGGYMTKSPVRLQIPRSDHWYVAIDLGGYSGTIRSSVRVLPGRLPTINDVPLSSVPSLVRDPIGEQNDADSGIKENDVFISHASEDKDAIVRSLADALLKGGLKVWYDEFELKIGDSLRRKIDKGLAHSRFGIVVLSQAFFKKGWTNYELDGLVTRSVSGEQILLPIWHNISKNEVIEYSPSLADKVARSTANYTVEQIASEIIQLIQEQNKS
jgi:hypothetical protein